MAAGNMLRKFGEVWNYGSKNVQGQTDRQTDMLIAIFRSLTGRSKN